MAADQDDRGHTDKRQSEQGNDSSSSAADRAEAAADRAEAAAARAEQAAQGAPDDDGRAPNGGRTDFGRGDFKASDVDENSMPSDVRRRVIDETAEGAESGDQAAGEPNESEDDESGEEAADEPNEPENDQSVDEDERG
jgi:hypothetical protein